MGLNDVSLQVYQMDNDTFENVGEINQFTSLMWPTKYIGCAEVQVWAPVTDENAELLKQGHILWRKDTKSAMVIETIKPSTDDNGASTYEIKGRTLEMLLTTRIVWGTYNASNKAASTIMYELVDQNCINPTDANRKIPRLINAADEKLGAKLTYQKTGGEVYDACLSLGTDTEIGFNIVFDPENSRLVFVVVQGVDRTNNQSEVEPIELSTDLSDIVSNSYYNSNTDLKTVALVAGEGESAGRKRVISGVESGVGFLRRELYVDARDLQSTSTDESGQQTQMSEAEYNAVLVQRGDEKLAECQIVETFDAKIFAQGISHQFGVDYDIGDKVTVRDDRLHVVVDARVTNAEETYKDTYELVLTFGYERPTLIQKVKQRIGLGGL